MIRKIIYIRILILSVLSCGSLISCIQEPLLSDSGGPNGNGVKITFSLTVPDSKEVLTEATTRSTFENHISNVFLLVFDENEVFIEIQPANEATGEYNYIASLTPQSRKCLIYVVANAPIIIDRTKKSWIPGTTTLDNVKNDLLKDRLPGSDSNKSITEVPAVPPLISVSPIEVNEINKSTTIADEILMERSTAKITISVTAPSFTLYGANLCDAPIRGYLFPSMLFTAIGKADYWGPDDIGGYSPEHMISLATNANPLYCYESPTSNNTYLIIKAAYKGVDGFYRIILRDNDKNQLALQRNHSYVVNIRKIQSPGYRTVAEAKINTPLNDLPGSDVDVDVNDGYSHDIVSNGAYYLGVENSEFIIYSQSDLTNEMISKVFWNAPTTVVRGAVSYKAFDADNKPVYSGVTITDCFTINDGSVRSGDLKVSFPKNVTLVSIQLRLGNLEKTINVIRKTESLSFGDAVEFDGSYTWGRIAVNNTMYQWISLSDNEHSEVFEGKNEIESLDGKVKIYLILSSNLVQNPDHGDREAIIYMARSNENGRTKVKILQPEVNIFDNAKQPIKNPYVGAFWRYNQTGERVIKMYDANGNTVSSGSTPWFAEVVAGRDFIKLISGGSADGAIYSSNPGNAESYKVYDLPGAKTSIQSTGDLVFRIGLKDAIQPNEHRYGIVLVHHSGGTERIFIRQGEAPDFLYRREDPVLGGWTTHNNNDPRPLTVKLSPYNLTDPKLGLGGPDASFYYGDHNAMPLDYHSENIANSTFNKAKLTEYPSQAGYFFIWNALEQPLTGTTYPYYKGNQSVPFRDEWQWIRAIHPLRTGNLWGTTIAEPNGRWTVNTYAGDYYGNGNKGAPQYEVRGQTGMEVASYNFTQIDASYTHSTNPCPRGYRYPHAGTSGTPGNYTTKYLAEDAYYSEIGQSMFYDPKLSNDAKKMSQYTLWGYYADGFFDRHKITSGAGAAPYSMVIRKDISTATGNDIGYMGSLTFNPFTYASIFHPAPGYWLYSMRDSGVAYSYWTIERSFHTSSLGVALCLSANRTEFSIVSGFGSSYNPKSVRCVRDYSLQGSISERNYD